MSLALAQEFGQILMLTLQDFQHRLDRDLQQRGIQGISGRQRSVVLQLARLGPSRNVELAAAIGVRPQSMAVIVKELEQVDLLERRPDPADARAKTIHFTAAGRRFIDELSHSTESVWQQYAMEFDEHKLSATFDNLKQLLNTLPPPGDDMP